MVVICMTCSRSSIIVISWMREQNMFYVLRRALQGSKRWIESFSGKHIDGMSIVAYANDQVCCVPHLQAPVVVGDCAVCNVDKNILLAA